LSIFNHYLNSLPDILKEIINYGLSIFLITGIFTLTEAVYYTIFSNKDVSYLLVKKIVFFVIVILVYLIISSLLMPPVVFEKLKAPSIYN